jgi:hypothetical protein
MQANYAPLAIKNAGVELEAVVPEVLRQPPVRDNYRQISNLYRRIATGILLVSGDPRDFFSNLFNSSRAFVHFLRSAPEDEKVTSQTHAFFDAVACRDEEGALLIATLSPQVLNTGKEYEEDFIYMSLLMRRFYLNARRQDLDRMLQEWAGYAASHPDVRLDVCRALLNPSEGVFEEAITKAIDARLEEWTSLRDAEMLHPDEASTSCRVSTEVLAWLEFANRVGLTPQPEYRLAPRLARMFHRLEFPPADAWQHPAGFSSLSE